MKYFVPFCVLFFCLTVQAQSIEEARKLYSEGKYTEALPLYEAIVNSIQSIEDASLAENEGFIDISIERASLMSFGEGWETDVENIIIKDNGIGFTDENYKSMNPIL